MKCFQTFQNFLNKEIIVYDLELYRNKIKNEILFLNVAHHKEDEIATTAFPVTIAVFYASECTYYMCREPFLSNDLPQFSISH